MTRKELFFLNVLEFHDDYKMRQVPAEMYNYCFSSEKEVIEKLSQMVYEYCENRNIFVDRKMDGKLLLNWYQENVSGEFVEKPFKYEMHKMIIKIKNGNIHCETEYF